LLCKTSWKIQLLYLKIILLSDRPNTKLDGSKIFVKIRNENIFVKAAQNKIPIFKFLAQNLVMLILVLKASRLFENFPG